MDKTNKPADQTGLENLPENEKKETQKLLDEIAADEAKNQKEEPKKEEPKAEKPEDKPKEDPPKEEPKPRKKAKLIPEYVLKTAESRFEKREKELLAELEKAKQGKAPADDKKPDAKPLPDEDVDSQLKVIAEESGVPESSLKKILGIVQKVAGKATLDDIQKLKDELVARSSKLDELTSKQELEDEERGFADDFEKNVLPLVKKEYGDDISPDDLADIKESLKEKAYDPKFKDVPLENLYSGWKEFRGLIAPKKKSAEDSRSGSDRIPGDTTDYENVTEDDLANMSREESEKYFAWLEKQK